jgi:hypothetical protein
MPRLEVDAIVVIKVKKLMVMPAGQIARRRVLWVSANLT